MTARAKPAKRRRRSKRPPAKPGAEPPAPLPPSGRGVLRWLAIGLSLVALAASTWLFILYPGAGGPGQGRLVRVFVPAAPSTEQIVAMLAAEGLIERPRVFALWLRVTGGPRAVIPGSHLLSDDASPRELIARLERRAGAGSARVTFPEGWTRFEMARRLQDRRVVALRDFLGATTDASLLAELGIEGESAEGFLFPSTYEFALDDDARDVVRRMKREFDRRWDRAAQAHSASLTDVMTSAKMGVRELVTLASLVEKEAVADDERPIIASVFLNRLRDPAFKPKHLECDPTAVYGCLAWPEKAASCATFAGKPTAAIEHDAANPYSTYTHEGLPPGPIANAGSKSIEAAMDPASTHFFFFVARGEGRHSFSETYEAHLAAIRDAGAHR